MPRRRAVIAAIVAGIILVAATASALALSAGPPRLPPVTTEQLLASILRALDENPALAGTVASHVDLGLPSFSGFGVSTDPASVVGGDHSIRVWMSQDGVRLDDLLDMAQRSVYVTPSDAWAWDSEAFTAHHLGPFPAPRAPRASPVPADPVELARRALSAMDATTTVALAKPRTVAGRGAYVLQLQPRTDRTLVGSIQIAIDAARKVPLNVSLFARGAHKAAVSVGFTSVRFGAVDASVYRFKPPAEATVKQTSLNVPNNGARGETASSSANAGAFRTFGSGWESIFAVRLTSLPEGRRDRANFRQLFPYSGPLFSAQLVERGDHAWIVVGLVPPSALTLIEHQLQ